METTPQTNNRNFFATKNGFHNLKGLTLHKEEFSVTLRSQKRKRIFAEKRVASTAQTKPNDDEMVIEKLSQCLQADSSPLYQQLVTFIDQKEILNASVLNQVVQLAELTPADTGAAFESLLEVCSNFKKIHPG